jgi:hypothetical protein
MASIIHERNAGILWDQIPECNGARQRHRQRHTRTGVIVAVTQSVMMGLVVNELLLLAT